MDKNPIFARLDAETEARMRNATEYFPLSGREVKLLIDELDYLRGEIAAIVQEHTTYMEWAVAQIAAHKEYIRRLERG